MNRRPVHALRLLTPIMPAGRRTVRTDRQLRKIRSGAIMWITGPVLFLIAQLAAQSAWRTPYSWMANPLSDLGAVHCQRTGSGYPLPRYVCSPLHQVMNVSLVTLGVLLAAGVLLTARCWGPGAASHGARALLIAAAAGSVLVGLVPEDVYLPAHLLGAILGIGAGNCGFILAGLIRQASPLARLRPLTLPLSILAMAATVLLFTGNTPAAGFGGMERLADYPLRCWMVIAGIYLLRKATPGYHTDRLHSRHTPQCQSGHPVANDNARLNITNSPTPCISGDLNAYRVGTREARITARRHPPFRPRGNFRQPPGGVSPADSRTTQRRPSGMSGQWSRVTGTPALSGSQEMA